MLAWNWYFRQVTALNTVALICSWRFINLVHWQSSSMTHHASDCALNQFKQLMPVLFITTFLCKCLSKVSCRGYLLSINHRQTTRRTVCTFTRRKGRWPSRLVEKAKPVKTIKVVKHGCLCVFVCECVGFVARSRLKWPLIVFLYYLIVKKSILACHSSEEPFWARLVLWCSVMSTFAWHSMWRHKILMMEFKHQSAQQ